MNFPPTLAFHAKPLAPSQPKFSAIGKELPPNVKLVTLTNNYASFNDGAILLRIAHLYSVDEHPTLSQIANVSLTSVFSKAGLKIVSAVETTLTGNQVKDTFEANKLKWDTVDVTSSGAVTKQLKEHTPFNKRVPFDPTSSDLNVSIRPMEVRTFMVKFA